MDKLTEGIKNIIFDFGGVIINIDFGLSYQAFSKFGITDLHRWVSQNDQIQLFHELEIGSISPDEFRARIYDMIPVKLTDEQFDAAWNALLLDIPPTRMELLLQLRKKYRIFLLSNTNKIHYDQYQKDLVDTYNVDFKDIFEKPYFSFEMGLAKPDPEIYKTVMKENDLVPEETLFIDDTYKHILGAQKTGLNTYFLEKGIDITELF